MATRKARKPTDDLRPEYDVTAIRGGVRGKYLRRAVAGTNLVLLDPDVAHTYRDSRTVNEALRLLANLARGMAAKSGRTLKSRHG